MAEKTTESPRPFLEGDDYTHINPQTGERWKFSNEHGGWISAPPTWYDTFTKDVPTAVRTGIFNRAVPGAYGAIGDIQQLGSEIDKATGTEELGSKIRKFTPHFPTSEDIGDITKDISEDVEPATRTGSIVKNIMGFVPALFGAKGVKDLLRVGMKGVVAPGVGSQVASDVVGNLTNQDPRAKSVAYLAGAGIPLGFNALKDYLNPAQLEKAQKTLDKVGAYGAGTLAGHALGVPHPELYTGLPGYIAGEFAKDTYLKDLFGLPGKMLLGGGKTPPTSDAIAFARALQEMSRVQSGKKPNDKTSQAGQ
jgi:hypothetical protein